MAYGGSSTMNLGVLPMPYVDTGALFYGVKWLGPIQAWYGLYGVAGLGYGHGALADGGVLAVWSAVPDPRFVNRMGKQGFSAEAVEVGGRGAGAGGPRHVILIGVKREELGGLPGSRRGRRGR